MSKRVIFHFRDWITEKTYEVTVYCEELTEVLRAELEIIRQFSTSGIWNLRDLKEYFKRRNLYYTLKEIEDEEDEEI